MQFIETRLTRLVNSGIRFLNKVRSVTASTILTMLYDPDTDPQYTKGGFKEFVKSGYTKNELIFACINKTANSAASLNMQLKHKKSGKPDLDSDLRELLDRPNPLMSEFTFWWFNMTVLLLAGVSYWQKVRDRNGRVTALWPMRPDWTTPVAGTKEFVKGYLYGASEDENRVFIPFSDVVDFIYYDPRNIYRGISPTAVACRVGDSDNDVTDYIKMFWERGAVPQGIITAKTKLTDNDITDIRRRWQERYGGFQASIGAPAILDVDAIYTAIGNSFKDMDFQNLDHRNEARICSIYDIPPMIVGASVGLKHSTYSNYKEARQAWWEDSLQPRYKFLSDELQIDLVDEYGTDLICEWDYSKVTALQEDRTDQFTRATSAVTAGYYTLNMAYAEIGLELLPPESGDVFLWTPATTPVHIDQIAEKIKQQLANDQAVNTDILTGIDTTTNDTTTGKSSAGNAEFRNKPHDVKTVSGDPLDHDAALEVADFSQFEIDGYFETFRGLPKKP